MSAQKHIALLVEIPAMYTDDLPRMLDEYRGEFETDSDCLLNCIGEPSVVRLRMEISGEKDSEVVEVWGSVRAAELVDPSRDYIGAEPFLTDEQLAEQGGFTLMRDERACEWCRYDESEAA